MRGSREHEVGHLGDAPGVCLRSREAGAAIGGQQDCEVQARHHELVARNLRKVETMGSVDLLAEIYSFKCYRPAA